MLALFLVAAMNLQIIKKPLPARSHEGLRDSTKNYIVLHNEGENLGIKATWRTLKQRHAGYHYFIDRAGKVYELINLKFIANHAGSTDYFGMTRWNNFSIGICLQGKSSAGYTKTQYESLRKLIDVIYLRYPEAQNRPIVGHGTIAFPWGRKDDPGPFFDFSQLELNKGLNYVIEHLPSGQVKAHRSIKKNQRKYVPHRSRTRPRQANKG